MWPQGTQFYCVTVNIWLCDKAFHNQHIWKTCWIQLWPHDMVKNNHIVSFVMIVRRRTNCENEKLRVTIFISTEKWCDIFQGLYKTDTSYIWRTKHAGQHIFDAHLACLPAIRIMSLAVLLFIEYFNYLWCPNCNRMIIPESSDKTERWENTFFMKSDIIIYHIHLFRREWRWLICSF